MPYEYVQKSGKRVVVYRLGERGVDVGNRTERIQDFDQLRRQCLANRTLFEDPVFPCDHNSVFGCKNAKFPVVWLRPPQMCRNPYLFVEGASRFDVVQGTVGNCWMVAAAANLTLNDELFYRVVPQDQSFHCDYAGIFHFRIWQANRWIDVVVDDRLPTLDGSLVFMKSRSGNEFWSALLEKAYAKLYGSYDALSGGSALEAMEDFTGGVAEEINLKDPPKKMFGLMLKAYERSSLMSCFISAGSKPEQKLANGLVAGHAYSITAVRLLYIGHLSARVPLIRLRNPWGDDTEWRGPWSDHSREWCLLSAAERQTIGLTFDSDGEFWMSEQDFVKEFDQLDICNLGPDSLDQDGLPNTSRRKWEVCIFEGSWVRGATAGGCRNYTDTFWMNPQYFITLEDPDDDDDDDQCTLIVALMQKNRRLSRASRAGGLFLTIGFIIYKVDDPYNCPKPLNSNFFKYASSVGRSKKFANSREVTTRFKLPPGTYCVVPSTFEPNQTADFLLRIYTEKKNVSHEHDLTPAIVPPGANFRFSLWPQNHDVRGPAMSPSYGRPPQLLPLFAKIAGDDMEVGSYRLQRILSLFFRKELKYERFSVDVCRSMVSLMDEDHSGKLGLDEFADLWILIRTWQNVFTAFDKDRTGELSTFELREALASAGYRVNQRILNAVIVRYGNDGGNVSFEDFIGCAVKLRRMIEIFNQNQLKQLEFAKIGNATFDIDDWLVNAMYS